MNPELPQKPYERSESEQKSLDLFHNGQELAKTGDIEAAITMMEQSQKTNDPEWSSYIAGTIAYLRGDLAGVQKLIELSGESAVILKRLAKGLADRGTVDYKADYYQE